MKKKRGLFLEGGKISSASPARQEGGGVSPKGKEINLHHPPGKAARVSSRGDDELASPTTIRGGRKKKEGRLAKKKNAAPYSKSVRPEPKGKRLERKGA